MMKYNTKYNILSTWDIVVLKAPNLSIVNIVYRVYKLMSYNI